MRMFLLGTALLVASICIAQPTETKTILRTDQTKVAAQVYRGKPGRPVFVLLNGLIFETKRWDPTVEHLAKSGATIIQYAYSAQPESLRAYSGPPPFLRRGFDLKTLAQELVDVLEAFDIRERVHIVGLSFGASVAAEFIQTHPARVESSIFVAPLIVPLETYSNEGRALRAWLHGVRFWEDAPCAIYGAINPYLCVGSSFWYDSFYEAYYGGLLKQSLKSAPEGVDLAVYKRSVFHLVRAARDFNLRTYLTKLPDLHFLLAEKDEEKLLKDQLAVWNEAPIGQRGSLSIFADARHAIPDEAPSVLADVLLAIANKDSRFQNNSYLRVK